MISLTTSARHAVLVSLWLAPLGAGAASVPQKAEVIVNIDMTADGKKVERPTPDKPAYYVPVILGYHTGGEIVGGEKPPARTEVIRQLGKALAKEGYVLQATRPDASKTLPSLILIFEWGYLNPQISDYGEDRTAMGLSSAEQARHVIANFNQNEMLTLVAGDAAYRQASLPTSEWEKLRDAMAEGRYYVIVSAFDFDASLKGERRLLWRARMSTERQGVWMDDVVPALVASGAPVFGREQSRPRIFSQPVRDGKVEVGVPAVVETNAPKR